MLFVRVKVWVIKYCLFFKICGIFIFYFCVVMICVLEGFLDIFKNFDFKIYFDINWLLDRSVEMVYV